MKEILAFINWEICERREYSASKTLEIVRDKIIEIEMRKLIDLDDETFKTLSKLAIDNKTNLKSYIESVLVLHAGGGFKDKKPSTKRKLKH